MYVQIHPESLFHTLEVIVNLADFFSRGQSRRISFKKKDLQLENLFASFANEGCNDVLFFIVFTVQYLMDGLFLEKKRKTCKRIKCLSLFIFECGVT